MNKKGEITQMPKKKIIVLKICTLIRFIRVLNNIYRMYKLLNNIFIIEKVPKFQLKLKFQNVKISRS